MSGGEVVRIRRAAILFAVCSAAFWEGIAAFWATINSLAGIDDLPYWMAAIANVIPASLYAVITLVFCHWLARRLVRQLNQAKGH